MRKSILFSSFIIGLVCQSTFGQLDSLQVLSEVILADVKLRDFSQGSTIETITDSTLTESVTSLTQVLRQESLGYLRENGPGGVSSLSLRGTTAQQTAVVWNGININSQLNGQTDFNTIAVKNYDNLSIRKGSGSIPYGSGAVGGSVHLNNEIRFGNSFNNELSLSYGSFNTPAGNYKTTFSKDKLFLNAAIDYRSSDNDFEYLDTDQINENGQFSNTNINFNLGVKMATDQVLKLYHNTFLGNRSFSGTLTAPSDDGYEDRNIRSLIEWHIASSKWESKLRFAHIFEQFQFFPNGREDSFSTMGKAIRYTTNYDVTYRFTKKTALKSILDFTTVQGEGTSIIPVTRNIGSAIVLWNHKLTQKLQYGAQLRQEITSDYGNPLLAGVGVEYTSRQYDSVGLVAKAYTIKLNASQNYRIPTFNDLYWSGPGATGNPDLQPERANQIELSHTIKVKNLNIDLQTYYLSAQDLIVWRPNVQGIWMPINVNTTENYGFELSIDYQEQLGAIEVALNAAYAYTNANDKDTGNQLIYVPQHKAISNISLRYGKLSSFYQFLYNDQVFTTTDNTQNVAGYAVSNFGLGYHLLDKADHKMKLSAHINNMFNKNYQTVAFRPNPGRNFLMQTTYTF